MKILLEYDEVSKQVTDKNGLILTTGIFDLVGFDLEETSTDVLALIKQGVSPDEIIKLKNNDLL